MRTRHCHNIPNPLTERLADIPIRADFTTCLCVQTSAGIEAIYVPTHGRHKMLHTIYPHLLYHNFHAPNPPGCSTRWQLTSDKECWLGAMARSRLQVKVVVYCLCLLAYLHRLIPSCGSMKTHEWKKCSSTTMWVGRSHSVRCDDEEWFTANAVVRLQTLCPLYIVGKLNIGILHNNKYYTFLGDGGKDVTCHTIHSTDHDKFMDKSTILDTVKSCRCCQALTKNCFGVLHLLQFTARDTQPDQRHSISM